MTFVTIPASVKSIINDAFEYCIGLTTVNWNIKRFNDFTENNVSPFKDLSSIRNFTFDDEVERIPARLCYGCTGLSEVVISNTVNSIGEFAFYNTALFNNLSNGVFYVDNWVCGYKGNKPDNIELRSGTKGISDCAFQYCTGLETITFGKSVLNLGRSAFECCVGLSSVTWNAKNCNDLEYPMFNGLSGLKSFIIGDGVEYIPANLCISCTEIESVTIPNSVKKIGACAFQGCIGLTSILIPDSVTVIRQSAFYNCTGLISIKLCDSISTIDNYTFHGCTGLTNIDIPNSVTRIGNYAFENCSGLTSVVIPNSVIAIGTSAFLNCTGMKSLTIGESVASIGMMAFEGCTGLEVVDWNAKNCMIPNDYFRPFKYLNNIRFFNFGDEVERIPGTLCKELASLEKVTIGKSVTRIDEAFYNCRKLMEIDCHAWNPPTVESNTFYGVDKNNCVLNVPVGSEEKYRSTNYWKDFFSIVENNEMGLVGDANGDASVNVTDVNLVVSEVLSHGNNKLYDVNGDGVINITDINLIVSMILRTNH